MSDFTKKSILAVGATSLAASSAYALTSTFNISISFSQPFTIVETTHMNFGTVIADTTANYILTTADAVSATGSGALVAGVPAAGDYTITDTGSAGNNIDIGVAGLTVDNGATPINPVCNWNAQGDIAGCTLVNVTDASGGKILNIGMTLQVDGSQSNGGSANPTFTISVMYN